jgi:hypothetical protein
MDMAGLVCLPQLVTLGRSQDESRLELGECVGWGVQLQGEPCCLPRELAGSTDQLHSTQRLLGWPRCILSLR